MTTQTNKLTLFFARVRAALKARKPKADDNIERHEPDEITNIVETYVVGIVATVFLMMFAYVVMTVDIETFIAVFLASQQNDFVFAERYAALTAILVLLINMIIIFAYSFMRQPGNGDVIEATNDQSDEINERFVELEHKLDERLAHIENALDDKPSILSIPDETISKRVH